MKQLEIIGAQFRFGEHPAVILRECASGSTIAMRVTAHQFRTLEAAGCLCCRGTGPISALAILDALGAHVSAAILSFEDGGSAHGWLLVHTEGSERPMPIAVAPVEALLLAMQSGVPILRIIDEVTEEHLACTAALGYLKADIVRKTEVPAVFLEVFEALGATDQPNEKRGPR